MKLENLLLSTRKYVAKEKRQLKTNLENQFKKLKEKLDEDNLIK